MALRKHAFEFLSSTHELPDHGICVLFGEQRFLVTSVLAKLIAGSDGFELQTSRLNPNTIRWSDLADELATQSLFGDDGPKLVILDDADEFVSANRAKLEALAHQPIRGSLLVLIVETWLATTKLAKAVSESGISIDCRLPQVERGKNKYPDDAKIAAWILERAKSTYNLKLTPDAVKTLRELCNYELGRIDQELAKVTLYVPPGTSVGSDTIHTVVGGWREETMWQAADAAAEGDAARSLQMLDKLFRNEEHPLALFGQIGWSLRRYVFAFQLLESARLTGRKLNKVEALKIGGFQTWQGEMDKAEFRLDKLGRAKLEQLANWILEADKQLKRSHSSESKGRLVLEKLVFLLADPKKIKMPAAKR